MVAEVFFTPYARPWLMDNTAPEPGDKAMAHEATK